MGKLSIDTYPRHSIQCIRLAYQQMETIRRYILSHNNHGIVIVRLLRMHFQDEVSDSQLQTNILEQVAFPF